MNADNRRHDDLGKGNCPMGKTPPKTLLTCGASYKPPALPGDTYLDNTAKHASPIFKPGH